MKQFLIFCVLFLSVQKQLSDGYVNARLIAVGSFNGTEKNQDELPLNDCTECKELYEAEVCSDRNSTPCQIFICVTTFRKNCQPCFKDLCTKYYEKMQKGCHKLDNASPMDNSTKKEKEVFGPFLVLLLIVFCMAVFCCFYLIVNYEVLTGKMFRYDPDGSV